jgi:hypothetical protein
VSLSGFLAAVLASYIARMLGDVTTKWISKKKTA